MYLITNRFQSAAKITIFHNIWEVFFHYVQSVLALCNLYDI